MKLKIELTGKTLEIFTEALMAERMKSYKRCLLEGCRYGIEGVDKEPKDTCIYCGMKRQEFLPMRIDIEALDKLTTKPE